ncbi:MAG: acyl-CoA dehydrogenase [Verrucomicrobiaceae bacterium]|nr:acyl-CoA dehydrogenase [Verrucomicrobiaceae bacterium]
MLFLLSVIVWLFVIAVVIYRELPLWLGSIIVLVAGWALGFISPALHSVFLWLPVVAILIVLNVPPLRSVLISARVKTKLATLLPPMSITEREALEAGTAWWDKELFSGKPDWKWFEQTALPTLTEREQSFLDNEVEDLCAMLDEWEIQHERKDLPPHVWQFLKEKGFFALIIPTEYGGLGFSAYAQSSAMTKLATRSITAGVTAMVPNSLGPGELLMHFGTDAQKQHWLPRLASGEEIPCFGLTGPEAGSDAGSIPDRGVVCYGEHEGQQVLGIRMSFAKRWITLAPVATVIGLAFKLFDPEHLLGDASKNEYGITCVLLPATHPGVEIGLRHNPSAPFMNGPVSGTDIFIPLDWIIGGAQMAGKGWRMLMHCLGAGRGISLPAVSTASSKVCYRAVGAFARIREQFHSPVGRFEGVQEATADIAATAYTLEAMRHWVTRGLVEGSPSVVTAIAKYHSTEMMRTAVDHAMDVMGGRGVQMGPRNPIVLAYQAVPIGITVEGANIMTRSLMIFGQGAMRCHPYLFDEYTLLAQPDNADTRARFDKIFFKHVGFTSSRFLRMFVLGLFGNIFAAAPPNASPFARKWCQQIDRFSSTLAVTADVGLVIMGGSLKVREMLSARLGDVLSQLFIASSIIKFHASLPADPINDLHAEYALRRAFVEAQRALIGFYENFPVRFFGWFLKHLAFPLRMPVKHATDQMTRDLGMAIMQPGSVRDAISECAYRTFDENDAQGRLELTFQLLHEVEPQLIVMRKAHRKGEIVGSNFDQQLIDAIQKGVIPAIDHHKLSEYERLRRECLYTDVFDFELKELRGRA